MSVQDRSENERVFLFYSWERFLLQREVRPLGRSAARPNRWLLVKTVWMDDRFVFSCLPNKFVERTTKKKEKVYFLCINACLSLLDAMGNKHTKCVCEALGSPDCCFWRAAEPRSASPGREPHKEQQLTCTDLSSSSLPTIFPQSSWLCCPSSSSSAEEALGPARRAAVWSCSRRRNADERFGCRPHRDVNEGL